MLLNFRQGLVTYQRDVGGFPTFLQASTTRPGTISIMVTPTPLTVTFAQGGSDYLATFEESVDGAWNTLQDGRDNYLYVDMDMLTSKITFGSTVLVPVVGAGLSAPQVDDQHWFDHSAAKMKVWSQSTQRWMDKIRVFVGKATSSLNIQQFVHGTSVGLNTRSDPGYPMLDTMLRPLRTSTGEFLTTNSNVRIKTTTGTSGVLAQPTNSFISVRAGENIPAMSLVYFTADDTVSLASSDPALAERRTPVGVVKQALVTNEIGTITQYGDITYDQWNWTGQIGKAVYCDEHGAVVTRRPAGLLAYRVGFIKNKNTIVLGIDAETEAQVYQAGPSQFVMNAVTPLSSSEGMNAQGERVITVRIAQSSSTQDGAMSKAQATALTTATSDIANHATLIQGLQTSKANVNHTHTIDQVSGLSTALDGKAPIIHTHTISNVSGLQAALDNKADKTHTHAISQVTGLQGQLDGINTAINGKANIVHTHVIADVSGLRTELDGHDTRITANTNALANKADKVHTHVIADVTGLDTRLTAIDNSVTALDTRVVNVETALDGKANKVHTHAIADVTNLQTTLDGKALKVHTHVIADTTGLQAALDGKAPTVHTHVIADVTNLQSSLDDKSDKTHNHALSTLSDVTITNATNGQFLSWNGTKWVNVKAPEGGGGTGGGLEIYEEESLYTENKLYTAEFTPDPVKFQTKHGLESLPLGIDSLIYPFGNGSFSTATHYTATGLAINLSLGKYNKIESPYSIIIGNGGSIISSTEYTIDTEVPQEQEFIKASKASVIVGGSGVHLQTPAAGAFMTRRTFAPSTEGDDGTNSQNVVFVNSENVEVRSHDSTFIGLRNTSALDGSNAFTTVINSNELNFMLTSSFLANAHSSNLGYNTNLNAVGIEDSEMTGSTNVGVLNGAGITSNAQFNVNVIGGKSTRIRDNTEKAFFERSSTYVNGMANGQVRMFNIYSKPGQSIQVPEYEFEQPRLAPVSENGELNITHYEFDATFGRDYDAGAMPGDITLAQILSTDTRAYAIKFSVYHLSKVGVSDAAAVKLKGLVIVNKMTGETITQDEDAVVTVREYNGGVFTNVKFDKLHFGDDGTPGPVTDGWTMTLTGKMTELFNATTGDRLPPIPPEVYVPDILGWQGVD